MAADPDLQVSHNADDQPAARLARRNLRNRGAVVNLSAGASTMQAFSRGDLGAHRTQKGATQSGVAKGADAAGYRKQLLDAINASPIAQHMVRDKRVAPVLGALERQAAAKGRRPTGEEVARAVRKVWRDD